MCVGVRDSFKCGTRAAPRGGKLIASKQTGRFRRVVCSVPTALPPQRNGSPGHQSYTSGSCTYKCLAATCRSATVTTLSPVNNVYSTRKDQNRFNLPWNTTCYCFKSHDRHRLIMTSINIHPRPRQPQPIQFRKNMVLNYTL